MKHLMLPALIMILSSVVASASEQIATKAPDLAQLQKMTARFAPTELDVDIGNLSESDRKALVKLVEAARIIDNIFMDAVLERRSRALRQTAEGYLSLGQGPPALLLDQQESLVVAGQQHRIYSGRARTQSCRARTSIPKT